MTAIRLRRIAAIAALAGGLSLAWFGFFFFRDNFSTHYPIKTISARIFRSGAIPYWNFFDGGGQPLAGNPNTLTFYPDNVLYLVLPVHVAFNLHFLLHLALGWFAMRALARSDAAAWMYVLSGAAISATAFYNLVTSIALIPFALLAAERRNALHLGLAFGLLGLAGEPVTVVAAVIAVGIVMINDPRGRIAPTLVAIVIAVIVAMPQLIAYGEIASEVERAHGYSARTVLNASLPPLRLLEVIAGPLVPRDPSRPFLFLSLFIGVIAVAALWQRSRYVVIALVMAFLALGAYNPIVARVVEALPRIRIVRFPEKFAIPMTVALCVLAAPLLTKRVWRWITFAPLVIVAVMTIPIDWFEYYDVPPASPRRVYDPMIDWALRPTLREDYRARAAALPPLFGAVANRRYALDRSPDGMFSLMTRIATERVTFANQRRWVDVAVGLPRAFVVPRTVAVHTVKEAVDGVESPAFDPRAVAFAPIAFTSAPARITRFAEVGQTLELDVDAAGPALVFVNETYFRAWDAGPLRTLPLDLDRLGILVPAGKTHVTLRFGRHHTAVAIAWLLSVLVVVAIAAVELRDRRTREIQRAGDDEAARV